jgi:hypothetical protein
MIAPKIRMLNGGRFIARHEGTTVYYQKSSSSQCKVTFSLGLKFCNPELN